MDEETRGLGECVGGGGDGGERWESAAFRSRVNCRDIVDRAARPAIKRLGQNVLPFLVLDRLTRGKKRARDSSADRYVKDEGMRKKHDGDDGRDGSGGGVGERGRKMTTHQGMRTDVVVRMRALTLSSLLFR